MHLEIKVQHYNKSDFKVIRQVKKQRRNIINNTHVFTALRAQSTQDQILKTYSILLSLKCPPLKTLNVN